jgi:hypothetical protein
MAVKFHCCVVLGGYGILFNYIPSSNQDFRFCFSVEDCLILILIGI